ncbi:7713_t:CDS:1, partial [Funneliformis geosporum]
RGKIFERKIVDNSFVALELKSNLNQITNQSELQKIDFDDDKGNHAPKQVQYTAIKTGVYLPVSRNGKD